jgi:hypothetical protein
MANSPNFGPLGAPVNLSVGNASSNAVLPGVGGDTARVTNTGATPVAVKFATSDQTLPPVAAFNDANSVVVNNNDTRDISMPYNAAQVAAIGTVVGPVSIYVQRGSGGV